MGPVCGLRPITGLGSKSLASRLVPSNWALACCRLMSAVLIPSRRSMSHLKKPWRVEAKAGEPAGRVAARVLRQRLKTIPRMLRAAAAHGDDHQPIHALRVATRRCTAALDTFGKLLPEKKRRWFAKQLKTLRRVAGEARDLDLLVERVGAQALGGSCGPAATTRRRAKEGARGSSSVLAMLTPMQEAARKPIRRARRPDRSCDQGKSWLKADPILRIRWATSPE